jgi:hypothetical protein
MRFTVKLKLAITFGLIIVQVALGIFAHSAPALGILHGPNALVLFGAAVMAFMRSRSAAEPTAGAPATAGTPTRV